ncbi:MAG: alpha/beta fold hydrolase [Rhodospirillaceae bacterium]|nr:alpha/beta fold hydrolase [Rhodospirillaceae bacterium]MBT6203113.1 alpha/beta fold hydrolase [Rhodospirillaceae bacterium]MBT6513050.1 alpha/beta fold hydrolase [Rhodospirillaceae bacterium]MBT7649002.1 alpha/beta fold hydrolase [Rhodospirillaceae bacterium]
MASFEELARITYHEALGARFRVAQAGDGPDIVWVPGGDSPAHYWADQFDHFHGDLRCTAYDPRGVGETTSSPPPWSMKQFGADCAAIIEAYCNPPVILTGLSMGALITQQVAIDYPHLVRLAIPMGTAAQITGFTRDWMQAEIDARANHTLEMPADFAACHYAAFAYPAQALADDELWERIKAAYTPRFSGRDPDMLIAQWQPCLDYDVTEGLKTCPVPIHAVAFAEDVQTPPQLVRKVAEAAQDGHYHELPGLGHVSLNRHAPDVVNTYLAELIAEHG